MPRTKKAEAATQPLPVPTERDLLYADLDEYQRIDALYNDYQKKREALGNSLKERLQTGTFVIKDLTVTKACTVAHTMDKKIVEKLLKDIGRQDIIDAAMTESPRVSLSVKRVATL